ncbi:unnamed protein product [Heterobilharzia americana]|nr:unnamed protein product [Heterobilharzia americana]
MLHQMSYKVRLILILIMIIIFLLGFLVEYRASVTHLHSTLFSQVFSTSLHHCQQPFTSSSHHLLNVTLNSNPKLLVSSLHPTQRLPLAWRVITPLHLLSLSPIQSIYTVFQCIFVGRSVLRSFLDRHSNFILAYSHYFRHLISSSVSSQCRQHLLINVCSLFEMLFVMCRQVFQPSHGSNDLTDIGVENPNPDHALC